MCFFLTAVASAGAHEHELRALAKSEGLGWRALEDSPVLAMLRPGEGYFLTTRGHCDCGTAIGALARRPPARKLSRKLDKLRKKGWSEAKIQSWLESSSQEVARFERLEREGSVEADRWYRFIHAAVTSGAARSVGLLLHVYRGSVVDEAVPLSGRTRVSLGEVDASFLLTVETDHLYDFVR